MNLALCTAAVTGPLHGLHRKSRTPLQVAFERLCPQTAAVLRDENEVFKSVEDFRRGVTCEPRQTMRTHDTFTRLGQHQVPGYVPKMDIDASGMTLTFLQQYSHRGFCFGKKYRDTPV